VTAKALRHYDALGLFSPAFTDPANGYRWYTPAQLPALRRIVALRDLGVPLREVADLVVGGADLRDILARRRGELEAYQSAIDRKLAALDIRVEMADEGPDVVMRTIDSELVASVRAVRVGDDDLGPLFYEVEEVVRDAGVRVGRPPGSLIPASGTGEVEVFVPVSRPVASGRVASRRLPGGRFASAIHHGPYEEMQPVIDGLQRWVSAAGVSGTGPMRVIYLRFGAEPELAVPAEYLASQDADFVTEVQIPVR
jgi:DNA-binding transcriptional MerR regulator